MNKYLYSAALILITLVLQAQNTSIKFEEGTWSEIVAKAQKENKHIFLDAYAAWCGPCKWMAANVFTDKEVAEVFNTKFINVKMDMEKGEGMKLAQRFQVHSYPTLMILSSGGEILHRACGALKPQELINWAVESLNEEQRFAAFQAKYDNGERSPEFMLQYLKILSKACLNAEKVADEYLNSLKPEALYEKTIWTIFKDHIWNTETRSFQYVAEYFSKFYDLYGEEINEKFINTYRQKIFWYIRKKDEQAYTSDMNYIKQLSSSQAEKVYAALECDYFFYKNDLKNYVEKSVAYITNYQIENPDELNLFAWNFYQKVNDRKILEKAVEWSKKAIELKDDYANNDTYAALQYKLGNKKEAQKYAEIAIKKAKEEGEDASETIELLNKIKALK